MDKALNPIEKKYLNEPVLEVIPQGEKVKIITSRREEYFDYCFMCSHPPEILKILKGVNDQTVTILRQFKYQSNKAVLHFDESVLPAKKMAWAAWNYLSVKSEDGHDAVSVSYLINKLQPLPFNKSVIVTLNPVSEIDSKKVVKEIHYEHPLFSNESVLAQKKVTMLQGEQRLYFAGAWLRYGFHEDGILSSKMAIKKLLIDDQQSAEAITIL